MEIATDERDARLLERRRPRGIADERRDGVALTPQRVDEVPADEARRAGDERLHTGRSYRR